MHGSSLCRMKWFVDTFLLPMIGPLQVLDVGSCDVAGGTYRQFFPEEKFSYMGLDMAEGPNVDLTPQNPYFWSEIGDDSFDVVISGQALEHMEFFWLALAEMSRVLKPQGLLCIVAPRGFERHRYPLDCYRFDADGMAALAKWCNLELLHASTDMQPPDTGPDWHIEDCEDSFLIARKPENWHGLLNWKEYKFGGSFQLPESGFRECGKVEKPPVLLLEQHEEIVGEYKSAISRLEEENARLSALVNAYEGSNSWKLTKPLRRLRKWGREMGRKFLVSGK